MLLRQIFGLDNIEPLHLDCRTLPSYQQQMENFFVDLKRWKKQNWQILIWMSTEEKCETLKEQLRDEDISVVTSLDTWKKSEVLVKAGWLEESFEFPQSHFVVLTEKQIVGKVKKPKRKLTASKKQGIKHFRDIHAGDYVVNGIHGIGRYIGVETIEVEGIKKDYLLIRYAGEDKLFLPTDQVGILQKYIGNDGDSPRVHKLGGNEWNRVKAKAKASAQDIAKELIEIYALRKQSNGYAFEQDTAWQNEFEDAFPYEETEDQLRAIDDVKIDMEKPIPMDRLRLPLKQ